MGARRVCELAPAQRQRAAAMRQDLNATMRYAIGKKHLPLRIPGDCTMSRFLTLAAAVAALFAASPASAQNAAADYPNRPVRLVVSVPAGGGVDTVTRIFAAKMQDILGKPVTVENKSGAAGSIAAEYVYKSDPDGYILLASQPSPITTNVFLYKNLGYDPTKFEPVGIMSHIANVLLVKPDSPFKTVQELVAFAKANPGKLNYASQGIGTTSHLTTALFETITGTKLVHVPYKGTAPALNDLIASHVDLMFSELATSVELHKAGKARILAVAADKRIASIPDIPTLAEAGVPGCETDTWNAINAPPKTPAAIVAKLNAAMNQTLKAPEVMDHFKKMNLSPGGGTPEEARAWIESETKRWGAVIKTAGIQPN
jgi:tripartite-type tricarboxylate transporter receptor subunit TctC